MHALIIEDEPLVAMLIEDILRDNGYDSFAFATSSKEAVTAAAGHCPDLITSDVNLSPGNGMDAVEEICRETPARVIFLTGNGSDVRERLPQYCVVSKPFRAPDLEAALDEVGG